MDSAVVTCPQCGKPALLIGDCAVRTEGAARLLTPRSPLYRCDGDPRCTQKVPYPGEIDGSYSDWDLEFTVVAGETITVRPSAEEFA